MESRWYVIQVMSGQEKKVKKTLEENRLSKGMVDLIDEIIIPSENVAEVKRGEQKITEKRLWPGYALIRMKMSDEAWMYVKNTAGVIDFMGKGTPSPLADSEVDGILNDLRSRKGEVAYKYEVSVGDQIKIIDGVFVNCIGTVLEVNHEKGRLSVMVSIFGRETRIDDLEFWQVEETSSDVKAK